MLYCEILLVLNVAESDMDCPLCGRLWSEQCCMSTMFI